MIAILLGIFLAIVLTGAVGLAVLFLACDAAAKREVKPKKKA